jgi:hypothetical protein
MRAVLVFCEGNHDVAFVTRSLGALAEARWVSDPIGKLPAPLGTKPNPKHPGQATSQSVIARHYQRREMNDPGLTDAARAPVPVFDRVVESPSDDTLYVMMRCGSDRAAKPILGLLDDMQAVSAIVSDLDGIAVAFVFDANGAGVDAREAAFHREYAALFTIEQVQPLQHGQWDNGRHGPVGLFVFHDPNTRTGTLEDVLAPLVCKQWPKKWDAAGVYLDAHAEPTDRVRRGPADHQEARIGVTGQFMFPGGPMTEVVQNREDGLSKERFTGPVSRALVDFLRGVRW